MRRLIVLAFIIPALVSSASCSEGASDLEFKGARALKQSQTEPDAILSAAIYYGKAAEAYEKSGDETKATEMQSYLYWCKKKMTLTQMDVFLKGGSADALAVAKRF